MTVGFGAFGKMPAVGDFFRLNAPAGFVRVWDDWVQRTLLAGQQALGATWDTHYMSAPIWRFSLAAGLAGAQPVMGVMMPSVDRVGRRFPLTLMVPLPARPDTELDHFGRTALFEAADALALDALEDDMSREVLADRLAATATPACVAPVTLSRSGAALSLSAPELPGALPALTASLLSGRFSRPSLWSSLVGDREHVMICDGLPDGPQMHALFDLVHPVWATGEAA